MTNQQLTMLSLFSGSGTWELSAMEHGIKCIYASEIEPYPIAVTKARFPDMVHLGNVSNINGDGIEPVDLITASFPCTDVSVAGGRAGLTSDDGTLTRSGLFYDAIRIIKEMRAATNNVYPKYIVFENVTGLFSSNKGYDFHSVLQEIAETEIPMPANDAGRIRWADAGVVELPDRQIAWRVMDAQYWGVPQRRKRVFVVASFSAAGGSAAGILFVEPCDKWGIGTGETAREETAADTGRRTAGADGDVDFLTGFDCQSKRIFTTKGVAPALCAEADTGFVAIENTYEDFPAPTFCLQGSMIGREDKNGPEGLGVNEDIAFTLTAVDCHAVAVPENGVGLPMGFHYGQSAGAGSISAGYNIAPTLLAERHDVAVVTDCAAGCESEALKVE